MNLLRSLRHSCTRFGPRRVLAGAAVFATGLLAAGAFSSSVPAAPQDCLPVIGCVTTTVPSVTLPTVTLPTLPISTTTTGGGTNSTTDSTSTTTTATTATDTSKTGKAPDARLSVSVSVRVRGHGTHRVIELRLRLTRAARVNALLTRNGRALKRNQFTARPGSSLWRLRLGRAVKPGAAKLSLTYRSSAGEIARSSHRLRLPR